MTDASYFVYLLTPVRGNLAETASAEEEAILEEHFGYLERALGEGTLIIAGPCLDGAFGIVIFKAHSEEAAREFMENDPVVKHGIMKAALHPFCVSLMSRSG